ncbi:alpha/beta fold hydrolase [Truepera radiovictrix]|uniref:Alpha/beta hydrolase fold protein n=1 Tax=Truepera radiovictrix (strain DSM 17093 / CIP 108686 / LMG 22925 / RQ-24) TaxID=649638 RepID=D7CSM6_TRURR|nr:alpha/beta hydrolase [Truepera radiovictrix]ADI15446.1 alpha/beta hydrolase fold protein [Truepera radiovictrix DSM 17093]WMT56004.1 alpha/beta hydrolase [Truepera radiovictrix]
MSGLGDAWAPKGAFLDEVYRLEVPGAELYVEQVGPHDASAVLYLHGGPGYNSYSFRELMGDELGRYRMLYADQRGAGRSRTLPGADPGSSFDVATLAGDALHVLDALGVARATLLAHGFGATVAAAAFARAPERVERLVWVNPWVDMPALAGTLQQLAAELDPAPHHPLEGGAGDPQDDLLPAERVEAAARAVGGKRLFDALLFCKPSSRLKLEHLDAEGFSELASGGASEAAPSRLWEVRAELAPLRRAPRPTVVLVGRDDRSCYPAQAERVLEGLPHALFSLLEAAHYPWLDDPETFTALLHEALSLPAGR